jgi:hypothetical protein
MIEIPPCLRGGGRPIDGLLLPAKKNCKNSVFLINIWQVGDGIIAVGAVRQRLSILTSKAWGTTPLTTAPSVFLLKGLSRFGLSRKEKGK